MGFIEFGCADVLILFALSMQWRSKSGPLFIVLIYKPGIGGERVQDLHQQVSLNCCQWEELDGPDETSLWGDKREVLPAIPGKAVCNIVRDWGIVPETKIQPSFVYYVTEPQEGDHWVNLQCRLKPQQLYNFICPFSYLNCALQCRHILHETGLARVSNQAAPIISFYWRRQTPEGTFRL